MTKSASMLWLFYLILGLGIFPVPANGIDLPLVFQWTSSNTFSIYPEQIGKQYSWNEFYRLDASIDSLVYKDMQLSLALRSHANFLTTYMSVEKAIISYQAQGFSTGAEVIPTGYGIQDEYQPARIVNPAQDEFLFQPSRFNGLFIRYGKDMVWQAEAGGNEHNLAVGKVSCSYLLNHNAGMIRLSQEVRTFESHLHKPVCTSALDIHIDNNYYAVQSLIAVAAYPAFEDKAAAISPMMLAEALYYPLPGLFVHLSASSSEAYTADYRNTCSEASVGSQFGDFTVSAGYNREHNDFVNQWGTTLLCKWHPVPQTNIGVYGSLYDPASGNQYYRLGMQAELSFGI